MAATDFVSTTTPELPDSRTIHPLSRSAMTNSKRIPGSKNVGTKKVPVLQFVEDQDTMMQAMLATAARNQFQQSRVLRAAATEAERVRNINKLQQRDFEPQHPSMNSTNNNAQQPYLHSAENRQSNFQKRADSSTSTLASTSN